MFVLFFVYFSLIQEEIEKRSEISKIILALSKVKVKFKANIRIVITKDKNCLFYCLFDF
jgi:hypothetical protein